MSRFLPFPLQIKSFRPLCFSNFQITYWLVHLIQSTIQYEARVSYKTKYQRIFMPMGIQFKRMGNFRGLQRNDWVMAQPDLNKRMATCPMQKQMKCLVSWVTQLPKFLPTTQCQVGLYFLSNSFLMKAAMSFSMLNFSRAWLAQSIASCCISSFISACLITAFLSAVAILKIFYDFKYCTGHRLQTLARQAVVLLHFQKLKHHNHFSGFPANSQTR